MGHEFGLVPFSNDLLKIPPGTSNVNYGANQVVPNVVTTKVGPNGTISVVTSGPATNFVLDIVGYFTP